MTGEVTISIVYGICIGIAATVTMDVLGSYSRKIGLAEGAKGQWVGRWYLGILKGTFAYYDIKEAAEIEGEKTAALVGHYIIGIALAIAYVFGADAFNISPDSFLAAVGYGLATCVFPWFLVFPALGFGIFGLKGPHELKLFTSSVLNHFFYGVGIWWTAYMLQFVMQ